MIMGYFAEIQDALIALLAGTNIVTFVTLRSTKKAAAAEAAKKQDDVLLARINFLDERVTSLEQKVCYKSDCKYRV